MFQIKSIILFLLLTISGCATKQGVNQNLEPLSKWFTSGNNFSEIELPDAKVDAWATCTNVYGVLKESEPNNSQARSLYEGLESAYKMVLTEAVYLSPPQKTQLDTVLSTVTVISDKRSQLESWLNKNTESSTEAHKETTYFNADRICRSNTRVAIKILKADALLDWDKLTLQKAISDLSNLD